MREEEGGKEIKKEFVSTFDHRCQHFLRDCSLVVHTHLANSPGCSLSHLAEWWTEEMRWMGRKVVKFKIESDRD
jgi:hypothetical protein